MRTDVAGPRTWLLAALAGWGLSVWLLALFGMGGQVSPLPNDPALVQPLPRLPPSAPERLGALAQYSETSARPLFNRARRPQPFFISGSEGEQPQAFDFVLSSVLITPRLRMAILQPTAGGESVRLKEGESPESMSSWRLVQVQPRSASFDGPEGPRTLELRAFDGSGGQAPTPVTRSPGGVPPMTGPAPPIAVPGSASISASGSGPSPSGRQVQRPANAATGATGETGAAPPDPSGEEAAMTTEQQMDAIRQRIEARRAQLRQAEKAPSSPNKTQ